MNYPIGFPITYPLDSDLCDGQRYSKFKQPGPELKQQTQKLLKQSMRYAKISDKITDNSDFTASNSKLNKLYLKTLKRVMLTFPAATLDVMGLSYSVYDYVQCTNCSVEKVPQ